MKEIDEDTASALAGDAECPLVAHEENEETHSAVTLKAFPSCYVLGASCEPKDTVKYFAFEDLAQAKAHFEELAATMRRTGTPFGPLC